MSLVEDDPLLLVMRSFERQEAEQEIGHRSGRVKTDTFFLRAVCVYLRNDYGAPAVCQALAESLGTGDAPVNKTTTPRGAQRFVQRCRSAYPFLW